MFDTRKPWLIAILVLPVAGCASGNLDGGNSSRGISAGSDCVTGRIRDFDALDNQNLILYGAGSRAYHATLATPAINLEREIALGVEDRDGDGRICPYGRDFILVDGPIPERVPISSIASLDEGALESLLIAYGEQEAAELTITDTETETE